MSNDGETLEGLTIGSIVDGQRKAELLDVIAQTEGVTRDQVNLKPKTIINLSEIGLRNIKN